MKREDDPMESWITLARGKKKKLFKLKTKNNKKERKKERKKNKYRLEEG